MATKAELLSRAADLGLDLDPKMTKDDIEEAIEDALAEGLPDEAIEETEEEFEPEATADTDPPPPPAEPKPRSAAKATRGSMYVVNSPIFVGGKHHVIGTRINLPANVAESLGTAVSKV